MYEHRKEIAGSSFGGSLTRRDCRHLFALDFTWTMVNHGAFGAAPKEVLAYQDTLRLMIERQPTVHMRRQPAALRRAADLLAKRLGAENGSLAFTDNATTAVNAVLKSINFPAGGEILLFSHAYSAVTNTAMFVARSRGLTIVTAELPFPHPEETTVVNALLSRLSAQTKLVILDHITSSSGILMPVVALIEACHKAGVPVLVDGAHAPGQIDLKISELNPAWYVGTCHKWFFAPRAVGFIWANPNNQVPVHPVVTSKGYDGGFTAEFDWTGTRDVTAALCVEAGSKFHESIGGHDMAASNHALVCEAANYLADSWGTTTGARADFFANMASVELPLAASCAIDAQAATSRLEDHKCDVSISYTNHRLWARISASMYNIPDDYERLADVVNSLRP
ncbi:aminotransferase class V-fold PLP-dependent enzyme [Sinorhizobium meliloti]|uniref:aminotransferase class V-fold PLP-dependent enzyme n=1 Tax=Rhizobium meliloti TaxID=382 RepID=UPI0012979A88|nr:aminotransferase class V-fold PLP-dependent enzyme [Sinorhizobium meliloti]MQW40798.1 aminotransferase class V-fold PLP-dependent enzyme [Sinorhizobium meliloti]